MLQNFGGSKEQGLYEIGYRFGALSLLITASLLNIFWKEIAEAKENGNLELMQKLYRKASRFLYTLGAVIAGFLVPWSGEIIRILLGPSYAGGSPVLALMLIHTSFASLAQINGSMLFASGETRAHVTFGIIFMGLSIPCSYYILASKEAYFPGLGLGSFGLAIKMLILLILNVNAVSWWISKTYGWKFDWVYQVVALGGALIFGELSFKFIVIVNSITPLNLFIKMGGAFLLYSGFAGTMIWLMPWVVGTSRQDIMNYASRLVRLSRT